MNCEEFAASWNEHVSGLLELATEDLMLEHSRSCDACGTRWRDQDELAGLLSNVLHPLKKPENLAPRLVERLPTAIRKRSPTSAAPAAPDANLATPWILGALLGGAVVYMVNGNSNGGPMDQLIQLEMMRRGPGGGAFPAVALNFDIVRLVIAMAFIAWISRASFWDVLFPMRRPTGLEMARWLAIPTLLIGALRLLYFLAVGAATWNNAMWQNRSADFSMWYSTHQLLEQLWTLGFWLTLAVLLFGIVNEVALRHARSLN